MAFLIKFISHPFGSFMVAVVMMYGVILLLDYISRKKLAQEEYERTPEGQQEKLENLILKLDDREKIISGLREQLKELEGELKVEAQTSQRFVKVQGREKESLEKQLKNLQKEKATLVNQLETLTKTSNELADELKELQAEKKQLESDLASSPQEEDVLRLEEDKEQMEGRIEAYRKLLGELEGRLNTFQRKDTVVAPEPESDGLDVLELNEEKDQLLRQVEQYKRICTELEAQVGQYRRTDTQMDESAEYQALVARSLSQEYRELEDKVDGYLETIEKLRKDNIIKEQLSTELEGLKAEFDTRVASENGALRETINRLKEQVAIAEGQKATMVPQIERIEELQQELNHTRHEREDLEKDLERLQREALELNDKRDEELASLKKRMSESDDSLHALKQENAGLREDVAKLKTLIEEKNSAISEIAEVRAKMSQSLKKVEVARNITNYSESPILSDDDLLADIEEPIVPKVNPNTAGAYLYNVFLPKLGGDKKEAAIPVIAEITGLSIEDAGKLAGRIVIPIAKGIAQDKADQIKARFMDVGVLARVRKQV